MNTEHPTPTTSTPLRRVIERLPRSWWVILAGAAVGGIITLVTRPAFVAATATNLSAVSRMTALLLGLLALGWVVERHVPSTKLQVGLIGLPLAAVAWWMIAPAFVDVHVEQDLPTSAADLGFSEPPAAQAPAPPAPTVTSPNAPDASPSGPNATAPNTTAPQPAPAPATAAPQPQPQPEPEPEPTREPAPPVALRSGDFRGLDGHNASGQAVLYRLEDGNHFLRLQDLDVDNGPGLELYLVPGNDQTKPGADAVFLGPLQGNQGSQNYAIPQDVQAAVLTGELTVLIWCQPFAVAMGGATLS